MQSLIDQLCEDVKHVRPSVEKTRPNNPKNPDVDRLEEDVNRLNKRWGNCCMQVVERLRSCEAACELLEKYNMSYQSESNWMDELDSKLRNLEELEAARAKEAWEKHVVSTPFRILRPGALLGNRLGKEAIFLECSTSYSILAFLRNICFEKENSKKKLFLGLWHSLSILLFQKSNAFLLNNLTSL